MSYRHFGGVFHGRTVTSVFVFFVRHTLLALWLRKLALAALIDLATQETWRATELSLPKRPPKASRAKSDLKLSSTADI